MTEIKRDHLSVSQINTYLRCPLQYYFSYIRGIKNPPKAVLILGSSVHKALEFNYKQKIKSHKDLKGKDVLECFDQEFKDRESGVEWNKEKEKKEIYKGQGLKLLEKYQEEIAPTIQPLMVEKKYEIQLDGLNQTFMSFIDLVDINRVITEHKTTARTPNAISGPHLTQMIAYSMIFQASETEKESKSKIHYLVKTKEPKFVAYEKKVTLKETQRFLKLVSSVAKAINDQNFYPNSHNFMCTKNGCGYWDICHKEF